MIRDGMILRSTQHLSLEPHEQSSRVRCAQEKCACACVRRGVLCTLPVAFTLAEREICSKKKLQDHNERLVSVVEAALHRFPCCYFHFFNADSTDLGLATHESAILPIDGPKMTNSTMLGSVTSLKMMMMVVGVLN